MGPVKRMKHTAGFKIKVIKFAKENGNRAAARMFDVGESSVREWKKNEMTIINMPRNKCALRKGVEKWPILEENVANWVLENRQNGLIITRNSVRLFALKWAKTNPNESEHFKATTSWCSRFMARNNLVLREKTKVSQMLPKDLESKLISFQKYVINLRRQKEYLLSQIGNMDETPVMFDMTGNKTIDVKGTKTVHIKTTGHEKSRFTVVLSCLADGTKLKPMVIFKRKTMPKCNFPKDIFIHVHEKGWMDENGVKLWIKNVWQKRPGALKNPESLLVWDMFRSHLMDNPKKLLRECNTDMAVIPGGLTSLVQPLDVCINKPFKANLKRIWNMWMLEGEKTFTKGGQIRHASLETVCEWIIKAWDEIQPEIVQNSFKKCSISNNLDGTEDDFLFMDHDQSDTDSDDTECYDVPENITQDEYDELFMS